jgi:tRNA threonylcarbamoyl adenosine modification protein (Sua5/YciO/YrdC/YwlC family)
VKEGSVEVDAQGIEAAGRALASGRVVAIPTDTVYGLAVDPFRSGATDRLFALKARPREVRLPVLVAGEEQVLEVAANVSDLARRLMSAFWPGALTVVLPRRPHSSADLGADGPTVAVRCPAHPVPVAVCKITGPLATTSANVHGQDPLTTADAVRSTFADALAMVLDGGTCAGLPSTIVDCAGPEPELLRPGLIPWEEIVAAAGA